jgi:hypothetical protein
MPDIFISYRRDDTSGYAGRLYDQISAHVGADHVLLITLVTTDAMALPEVRGVRGNSEGMS